MCAQASQHECANRTATIVAFMFGFRVKVRPASAHQQGVGCCVVSIGCDLPSGGWRHRGPVHALGHTSTFRSCLACVSSLACGVVLVRVVAWAGHIAHEPRDRLPRPQLAQGSLVDRTRGGRRTEFGLYKTRRRPTSTTAGAALLFRNCVCIPLSARVGRSFRFSAPCFTGGPQYCGVSHSYTLMPGCHTLASVRVTTMQRRWLSGIVLPSLGWYVIHLDLDGYTRCSVQPGLCANHQFAGLPLFGFRLRLLRLAVVCQCNVRRGNMRGTGGPGGTSGYPASGNSSAGCREASRRAAESRNAQAHRLVVDTIVLARTVDELAQPGISFEDGHACPL